MIKERLQFFKSTEDYVSSEDFSPKQKRPKGRQLVSAQRFELSTNGLNVKYGPATLCVGVGQGEATIFEQIE